MPPVDLIPPGEDTIRILLTTDNHVGYLENDPVRGDDSWKTFQEITSLAKLHDVDMVVQGGDLFHVSKPSKKSFFHVIQLLRLNCLGDRPCELELLSDPAPALRQGDTVNYEDPNLNVSVPVFAISGNHDDATGEGLLLPMDVLAATGLINYFGQIPRLDKITVTPLVFQKGTTKLALYGINNMRDERLQRIMRNGDVTFQKPKSDAEFFNLLCVHQNHYRHTMTSYVPEDFLPSFLDFVLWGHEHECIPFPQYNPTTGFDTLQPGSSVATALSEGETAQKHVFILDIKNKDYAITSVPLQTVRPFLMRDVCLKHEGFVEGPASKTDVQSFLNQQVEELISQAVSQAASSPESGDLLLPLIRLRVDHTGNYEVENSRRFSNRFVGRIANVNDILLYHKKKTNQPQPADTKKIINKETDAPITLNTSIQKILREYLGDSNLNLVPEAGMFDVTKRFIEQDDKLLLTEYVESTISNAAKLLLSIKIDENEFHLGDDILVKRSFRQLLNNRQPRINSKALEMESEDSSDNAPEVISASRTKRHTTPSRYEETSDAEDDFVMSEVEDDPPTKKTSTRSRQTTKSPKTAKPRARRAATKKKPNTAQSDFEDLLSLG
ncbi:DNA repair exonuclease [Metschnikowia bicuspidata var. bicuspidata NRRL YB-4993]|uniref:Double-strand break repair protein n=1 Tax=Metschnikowia bicuspidata var. bicuspidata NRRL YB-4993 TaxID=869754 RepID=A0A1A0HB48_9ASCO|nr:DNA repair exonuclease [Metschnikowia bicuspidata var. bicuspidata NRRL YB-4993]OBA21236.1 DNA repair exonuclease [Metschnikowia bicuspidata var. bicuspidata NRRL YB-4993]